jgi:YidC/Oxa1 family membrane protein insertase
MFLQLPVFLGLFHVLRRLGPNNKLETLYGWSSEQFREASVATLFTAPISGKFGSTAAEMQAMGANPTIVKVIAGCLVLLMMVTTYLTSRQMILKTGWAEDPQQKMIQRLMLYGIPLSLLVSGAIFPIGVIIYWVTNNLFTLAQQQWVLRKYPPPPMAKKPGDSSPRTPSARAPKSPVQPAKSGLFGRKAAEPAPVTPVVDTKALAPKPGVKPVNPKKGTRPPAKRKG